MLAQFLAVAAGGGAGAAARFAVQLALGAGAAPSAVLLVNAVGSAIAGAVLQWSAPENGSLLFGATTQAFFVTGFCGAFTTMSALTVQTRLISLEQGVLAGGVYAMASLVLSIAALLLGMWLVRS